MGLFTLMLPVLSNSHIQANTTRNHCAREKYRRALRAARKKIDRRNK